MAAIQRGNTTGPIYDVEMTLHQNAEGACEGQVSYRCAWSAAVNSLPPPLSPHPDHSSLLLFECESTRENGDVAKITATYRGILIGNPKIYTQTEFNVAATSEPIETHPLFSYPPESPPVTNKQIAAIQLALDQNRDPVDPDIGGPLTGPALLLFSKKRRGIDSFMRIGAQFRKSYIQRQIPSDYSKVGKISAPNDAPSIPSSQNYLFVGYSWRKAGGVCSITEDYQASGLGGWDVDLYA